MDHPFTKHYEFICIKFLPIIRLWQVAFRDEWTTQQCLSARADSAYRISTTFSPVNLRFHQHNFFDPVQRNLLHLNLWHLVWVFLLCLKPALERARRLTNDWSYLAPYGNPTMPIPTWQRVLCFFLLVNDCTMHTSAWQGNCSFWRAIISFFLFWFVLGEWVYPWCQRRLPAISKLDISVPNIQSPLLFNFQFSDTKSVAGLLLQYHTLLWSLLYE